MKIKIDKFVVLIVCKSPEDLLKILLIFVESCLVCIQNVQIMHANIDVLNSLVVYTTFDTNVPVQLTRTD